MTLFYCSFCKKTKNTHEYYGKIIIISSAINEKPEFTKICRSCYILLTKHFRDNVENTKQTILEMWGLNI